MWRTFLFLLIDFVIVCVIVALVLFVIALILNRKDKRKISLDLNTDKFKNPNLYAEADNEKKQNAHVDSVYQRVNRENEGTYNTFDEKLE